MNLGTEYDFSKVTEDTKQATYEEYEKYYKNLDTELTNLKMNLTAKFLHQMEKLMMPTER